MFAQASPKQRVLVIGLILFGILFTIFFGMRAFHAFKKFDGHRPPPHGKIETDVELIRDWMTVSFIAKTYHIHENDIYDALKIPPQGNHDKNLSELNSKYYPGTDGFVLDTVKAAVKAHQPPPPPGSATPTVSPPTVTVAP